MTERTACGASIIGIALLVGLAAPARGVESECDRASQRSDWSTALFSCEHLARTGDAPAQLILGTMYLRGQGVSVNPTEAARWFERSAEQGNIIAQTELGVMYAVGIGVRKDYVLAHMWLSLAASSSVDGGRAADKRELIERSMLPLEIQKATKRAEAWKDTHGRMP